MVPVTLSVDGASLPEVPHSLPRRARLVPLDRSLESLPLFRLSDSAEDAPILFSQQAGCRWRVIPPPGQRLPGTFDQDVYVELCRRYHEAGSPSDGVVSFTLHAFLHSMGRRADGRTYEQLRNALSRLERTMLESQGAYWNASRGAALDTSFPVLAATSVRRRRAIERDQLSLFPTLSSTEPGEARVVIAPLIRANIASGHVSLLAAAIYFGLASPVARRLYRLLSALRSSELSWQIDLEELAARLPLAQRFPSHLLRVLQPAHEMLTAAGIVERASLRQRGRQWVAEYLFPQQS
jgi:plasmid replication initiation protein